ncbi:MAG: bifunctional riboflavin kinase/FAD synthetase [Fuerstiella sp.]|nr:bifunctional riboflavin kinase/FAD synthetase [Fuerstiella sp.]
MNYAEFDIPGNALQGVVTVGNFDGVHRGHQQMLQTLRRTAAKHSAPAVVVTFDPHPLSLLRPDSPLPRLTTIERRSALLKEYGADEVVVLPVTNALLQMTPEEFFDQVLVERFAAAGVVEGPNFRFGRDRAGDIHSLAKLCQRAGIVFHEISPVQNEGRLVSSSRIRTLLSQGRAGDAVAMTGHAHRISGVVSCGAGRGKQLGFPTANLDGIPTMLPASGVYAGTVCVGDQRYSAALSIGPNPTFADNNLKVECHLLDFNDDLYDDGLEIDLLSEIRPLRSFDSVDQLIAQIAADVEQCRMLVDRLSKPVYKICSSSEWQQAVAKGEFSGSEADLADGFIHFSTADQLRETAARHFSGQSNLLLVEVDPIRLGSALKWELSRGGRLFPHLYDCLPVDAAVGTQPLPWISGTHRFPREVD